MLRKLQTVYKQSGAEIASLTLNAVAGLRKQSLRTSPREVMEVFTWFYGPDAKHDILRDYAEDVRCYVILRQPDKSHTIAAMLYVETLRLVKELGVREPGNGRIKSPTIASGPSQAFDPPASNESLSATPSLKAEFNPRAETLLKMGKGLEQAKKREAALEYYRRVVQEYSTSEQAIKAKERIKQIEDQEKSIQKGPR